MSRYAARDSTGRVCADIEPMGVSASCDCGEDRSLDTCLPQCLTEVNGFYGTDQKRTDLSEPPDTSSRREGTTRSVLTKSECARVDEITALVLKRLIRVCSQPAR